VTYVQFLVVFLFPPLALAGGRLRWRAWAARRPALASTTGTLTLAALIVVACAWTLPWDSWIIGRGVWGYPPGRVSATLWRVPVEEIGFMAAQTALVALWSMQLGDSQPCDTDTPRPQASGRWRAGAALACASAVTAAAALAVGEDHGLYLASMVCWFAPALALQYATGAHVLAARRRLRLVALLPCWLYLCVADRVAIGEGVWHISRQYTFGVGVAGLPLEEIVFFGITCLLVVNTVVLVNTPGLGLTGPAIAKRAGVPGHDHRREARNG
jgi:lycopene cyclase domain-containing protein